MIKFKCRPADEYYHDDPHYTKEVEVEEYYYGGDRGLARAAAAKFAEEECQRKAEYTAFDVQVLTERGWETFEIHIASVPEFSATRRKGVEPVPDQPWCEQCGERFAGKIGDELCNDCEAKNKEADECE